MPAAVSMGRLLRHGGLREEYSPFCGILVANRHIWFPPGLFVPPCCEFSQHGFGVRIFCTFT